MTDLNQWSYNLSYMDFSIIRCMKNTLIDTVPLSAKIILYFHIEHCTHTKKLTLANILLSFNSFPLLYMNMKT